MADGGDKRRDGGAYRIFDPIVVALPRPCGQDARIAQGERLDASESTGAGHAIVLGAEGRVGGAFAKRLAADGYAVSRDPRRPDVLARAMPGTLLFDCAYRDGEAEEHVWRVAARLAAWRDYAAIFVPSSCWIEADSAYGRAKRRVEELAAIYRGLGAHVVTDRIGYFPGDGVTADPSEPMIDRLVDGDTLYARVMAQMVLEQIAESPRTCPPTIPA